jgi:hypothetical protein
MNFIRRIAGVLLALAVAACGGGGGGGGGSGGGAAGGPPASVGGNWTVTEASTSNTCGDPVNPPYQITIAQNGSSITVTTPAGTFAGSLNGQVLNWSGSYPDNGGTTTINSLTATVSGSTFSGTSSWTWTDGTKTCGGTTTFSGITAGTPAAFTIGGTISGLSGTVVLQNNGGDNLSQSTNGGFTFAGTVSSGSAYNVTVLTQPAGQTCTVSNASGTATASVSNVSVVCSTTAFTLSVTTAGSGSVSRNPNQGSYAAGSQVQLTAVPQPGNSFSSWSGGLTGTQNPATVTVNGNLSITAHFAPAASTLTVVKAGQGSGTVTGTGINCGTDCSQSPVSGTMVLTATPAAGSTFGSWTGCDSVSTNQCTVNVTSSRTVTATFNLGLGLGAPVVSVPATSANGSYSVTISPGTGLASTTLSLQEAPDTAFVSPTSQTFTNVSLPLSVPFTGKAAGAHCYRAAFLGGSFGNTACVTVSPVTTSVLRIVNNSSYDLIDVRLNNVQQANFPNGILAGNSFDFVFGGSGTVSYALGNGFYNPDQSRNIWFTFSGQATLTQGQTFTLTVSNPTIGQLLAAFSTTRNWDGQYFDGNLNPFFARYTFRSATNGWQLFDSTSSCFGGSTCTFTQIGSGTLTLVSWPKYSSIVTFKFSASGTPVNFAFPFGSFQQQNGPPSWPIIEYVMQ